MIKIRVKSYNFKLALMVISVLYFGLGCKNNVFDGRYCAKVEYYNPNSSTHSDYTLTITVDNNLLTKLDFPQGYLTEDDLPSAIFSNDGKTNFTLSNGYEYTVKITGPENNCFDSVPKISQCRGITKKGIRCKKTTDNPSGLCWNHKDQ